MTGSHTGDPFSAYRGAPGQRPPGAGLWDAVDQLRGAFEPKPGTRAGRGDVRAAILALLAETPMHGYQIIHEIDERSAGAWKPSPGSVYPTLQLLADEGLVRTEAESGRKTYSLTDEGREAAQASGRESAPWDIPSTGRDARMRTLPKAGIELAQAITQVGRSGSTAQVQEAVEVVDQARRRLYSILAQD